MSEQQGKRKVSRRKFLVRGGLGTIGILALGTYVFRNPLRRLGLAAAETIIPPYSGTGTEINLWFEITQANKVILHSPKVEMGQGTFTSMAQMAADELEVSMDQIMVVHATTATGSIDGLSTGGSTSVSGLWQPLRELAATMREMIKNEAAKKMGGATLDIRLNEGVITLGNQSMTYAEAGRCKEAIETIEAQAASPDDAELLGIKNGAPLLCTTRYSWDDSGNFVEYVVALYLADLYQYTIRLKRA